MKRINLFLTLIFISACTSVSKTSMKSIKSNMLQAPVFGRIVVRYNGDEMTGECNIEIKTKNKKFKYSLDRTGEVYFQAEEGIISISYLECNTGWDWDKHFFLDRIPAFVISDPSKLTYFGRIEINWERERKFNTMVLIPAFGTNPTYSVGPLTAEVNDEMSGELIPFSKLYPEIAARPIDKSITRFVTY